MTERQRKSPTSFWQELRRRNVFKVAVAYGIVAWLIVQVASIVFPALQLEAWTVTFVTAALILGFPVALFLAWAYEVTPKGVERTKQVPLARSISRVTAQKLNYTITTLLSLAVTFLLVDRYAVEISSGRHVAEPRSAAVSESEEPVRLVASLPPGVHARRGRGLGMSSVALSPDGRTLVIAGTRGGGQRLYRRPLGQLDATPLPGTEGGMAPFFSPDGAWLAFFADGMLKRVPADGGTAVDIAPVQGFPSGGTWGPDDRIVFSGGVASPLHVVSVRGGEPDLLKMPESEEAAASQPHMLPGGNALLFQSAGFIHVLDLDRGRRFSLGLEGSVPSYVSGGHVLLMRGADLLAVPFDLEDLEVTGPAVPVVEGVAATGGGASHYAVSASGALAYVPATETYELVLIEPDGSERLVTEPRSVFENPQFSPDGRQLVVAASGRADQIDLWIHNLETELPRRLTFNGGRAPVWTPNGGAVTFSHLGEGQGIYTKPADGRSEAELVLALERFHWLVGWTPDESTLVYGGLEEAPEDAGPPSSISLLRNGQHSHIVAPGDVWGGRLSPDGRWLAYYVREAGQFAVYVTPFPDADTRWPIAEGDSSDPSWAPDGTEVYYRSGDRLMAAEIDTSEGAVRVVSRRVVIEPFFPPLYDDYDIHPDGETLVLVRPAEEATTREVTVVLDWLSELERH